MFRRKPKVQLLSNTPVGTQYGDPRNERVEKAKSLDIDNLLSSSGSAEDTSDGKRAGSHDPRERKLTPPPRSLSPTPRRNNIQIIPLMQPKRPISVCLSSPPINVGQQSPTREVGPTEAAATPPRPRSTSPVHRRDIKIVPLMEPKRPVSGFLSSPKSTSPTHGVEPTGKLVATPPHPGSDSRSPVDSHDYIEIVSMDPKQQEVSFEVTMPSEEPPNHEISHPPESTSTPKAEVIRRPEKKQLHAPPSGRPRSYTSPDPPQVKIVPLMAPKNPKALGSPLGRAPLAVDESSIAVKSKSKATSPGPSAVKQKEREKEVRHKPKGTSSSFGPTATAVDDINAQKKAGKASLDRHGGLGPAPISFDDN